MQDTMTTLEDYLGPLAAKLPKPNYVDPETRVPILLGMEVSMTVLMVVFLSARLYSRIIVTRNPGWDDIIMGLAAAVAVAQAIALCVGTKYGIAYHLWDIRPRNIPMAFKMLGTDVLLIYPAAALCRISVCMGYIRLFPSETTRRFCYIMMMYSGMWGTAALLMALFVCTPVTLAWNHPFSPERKCGNSSAAYMAIAALNSFGDVLVFLWPAHILYKLQMPLKRRLGLIILFCIGCCIVAISVCRVVWLLPLAKRRIDRLYTQSRNLIAASAENDLSIICGCLPIVKACLKHLFPRLFGPATCRSTTVNRGRHTHRRQNSASRKHDYSGSHTDPAFSFSYDSCKDSDGYKLQAVDSSCDTDEGRLIRDVEVVPVPKIAKTQESSVRTSPLHHENSGAEALRLPHVETPVDRNSADRDSVDSRGSC